MFRRSSSCACTTRAVRRWPPRSWSGARERVIVRSAGQRARERDQPRGRRRDGGGRPRYLREFPKPLTDGAVEAADVVVTMGCGDACPFFPGSATWTGSSTTRPANPSRRSAASATRSTPGCGAASRSSPPPPPDPRPDPRPVGLVSGRLSAAGATMKRPERAGGGRVFSECRTGAGHGHWLFIRRPYVASCLGGGKLDGRARRGTHPAR